EGDLHIVVYWVESCLILHNMVVWFEEQYCDKMDRTTQWAISEGEALVDGDGDICLEQPAGMEGQHFHAYLMQRLFDEHGIWF
ncbi:hypothetical protein PAXRUDRAFT_180028, partial [Paxillus rubicundulus Ve08.2h10]